MSLYDNGWRLSCDSDGALNTNETDDECCCYYQDDEDYHMTDYDGGAPAICEYFEIVLYPEYDDDHFKLFVFNLELFQHTRRTPKKCSEITYFNLVGDKELKNTSWNMADLKLVKLECEEHQRNHGDEIPLDVVCVLRDYLMEEVHKLAKVSDGEYYNTILGEEKEGGIWFDSEGYPHK